MPVFPPRRLLEPVPPVATASRTATDGLSSPQEHDTKEGKMRRFFMLMLVAVATGLIPAMVRADNPNQEAANQIRDRLNGQLSDQITVRYLNGTVWLQGHVRSQEQLEKAVALVFSTEGVVINKVIRDELTVDGAKPGSPASYSTSPLAANVANPLRGADAAGDVNRAQALPSSFNPGHAATPVLFQPPAAALPAPVPAPVPLPPVPAAKLPEATTGVPVRTVADVCLGHGGGRSGPRALRSCGDAGLRLAELCRLSELCRGDLSQAVLADRLAVHRSLLSLSAGPVGLAEGEPGMGRRLVVVVLQGQAALLLVAVAESEAGIPRPQGRLRGSLDWAKTFSAPRSTRCCTGLFCAVGEEDCKTVEL